jgi:hypothetical protein
MYNGLLHLHNLLRWVILVLLVIALFQSLTKREGLRKSSLWLLISAHITLLIGLYQYFASETVGYSIVKRMDGFGSVMKDSFARFWVVEHFTGMLIAIIIITIARGKAKKLSYGAAFWLYLTALIILLISIPWPFRETVARPWFPGM